MEIHRLEDVYGTSREVAKTYVERELVDSRFVKALSRTKHIVLYGGSKQGKSSIRKHSLAPDDCIVVQCHREASKAAVYEMILKDAGIKVEVSDAKTLKGKPKLTAQIQAESNRPFIARGSCEGGESSKQTTLKALDLDPEDPTDVARVLNEAGFTKFIVLEDFHYLEPEIQRSFAFDLKVFHEVSKLIFVIVGVWMEANRLTLFNGDLSGRITNINVDDWSDKDLQQVISAGESLLNVKFSEEAVSTMIKGCQGNVGVLQEVCQRVCESSEIWETQVECQVVDVKRK